MRKLILVRHGLTEWNKQSRYQGQKDSPLSREGMQQSRKAAEILSTLGITKIYTSPLTRARYLAEIVAEKTGRRVHVRRELIEINHGSWENMLFRDIRKKFHDVLVRWWTDPTRTRMPGGESLRDVAARVERFLGSLPSRGVFLAVTHDVPLRLLILKALDIPLTKFWRFKTSNAGITVIDLESNAMEVFNYTGHLGSLVLPGKQMSL